MVELTPRFVDAWTILNYSCRVYHTHGGDCAHASSLLHQITITHQDITSYASVLAVCCCVLLRFTRHHCHICIPPTQGAIVCATNHHRHHHRHYITQCVTPIAYDALRRMFTRLQTYNNDQYHLMEHHWLLSKVVRRPLHHTYRDLSSSISDSSM